MTTTTNSLTASKRDGTGKGVARKLRRAGKVPAVVYGKDMDTVHLTLDAHEAMHLFQSISVENTIVDLEIEGEKGALPALVREIQMHPYRNDMLHVDFLRIQKGVAVDVEVPVRLDGQPAGVRLGGGALEQIIYEMPVRCIPSKIPAEIVIDVTGLELGESLHVYDLEFDEGVEVTVAPERTVCLVAVPRGAAEDEEAEEELALDEAEPAEGEEPAAEESGEGEG